VMVVVARTVLLAFIAFLCYRRLRQQPNPELKVII
jgi:hypothetical protein